MNKKMNVLFPLVTFVASTAIVPLQQIVSAPNDTTTSILHVLDVVESEDIQLTLQVAIEVLARANTEDDDSETLRMFMHELDMTRMIILNLLDRLSSLKKQYDTTWVLPDYRYSGREYLCLRRDLQKHTRILRHRLLLHSSLKT